MRHTKRFDHRGYKIAQPGYIQPIKKIRGIVFVVLLLGGAWLIFNHLFSLPTEAPTVTRYEILPLQQ